MITAYLPDGHIQTGSFALEEPTALEKERRHTKGKGAWYTIMSNSFYDRSLRFS